MTYVSRIQCVKSAIDSQVNDMANGAENRKVGIVTFNHEVNVIGDDYMLTSFSLEVGAAAQARD